MRSRERLIEVLRTVNDRLKGGFTLRRVADTLAGDPLAAFNASYARYCCEALAVVTESPHFRELAQECVFYLSGGVSMEKVA